VARAQAYVMNQTIQFATTGDGVKLAYAISGSGPPLLKTANWMNHLEFDWESPVWRHWFDLFSAHHRLYRYDVRGSGLSDWVDTQLSFESQISDLERIVDAAELESFALLGISQGASVAIEYAVRHPDRVTKLVIHGGFVQGWAHRGLEAERTGRAQVELVRVGWGQQTPAYRRMFAELFIPAATEEQMSWFAELQRRTTRPEIAAIIMETAGHIDIAERMHLVKAPTLVLHPRGDVIVPFDQGRIIAAGIPNAKFVALDSDNHLLIDSEPAWRRFQTAVGEFLGWRPDGENETAAQAHAIIDKVEPVGEAPARAVPRDVYEFNRCRLDVRSRELTKDGRIVAIEQRAFNMLVYLIEHRDRAISKDELQEAIWPRMILTESALTRCVMKARRAVGDDPHRQTVIKTIHGHGYRFVAPLQ
jgi:pimeloyl-ACP methyl ester carboxylesterase/DNA-binding winged helix-turn-helix (wHTH) protein